MKLGKYTYGMYLYHSIFLIGIKKILTKLNLDYENNLVILMLGGTIVLLFTIVFSMFSYEFFELRFLKLKNKFAPLNYKIKQSTTKPKPLSEMI